VDTSVQDNPAEQRYEIRVDGELAGFTTYRPFEGGLSLIHTEIDPRFEGKGLATTLIRHILDEQREQDRQVLPFCPFVRAFIQRHRDYVDLVPEEQRARFDL
jgi:predicted GNAT family acetyltransferase